MAGFAVATYGRIWVAAEEIGKDFSSFLTERVKPEFGVNL